MKIIAVRSARAIWLIPTYFLNPRGMFVRPLLVAMKERYAFLKTPLDNPFPPPNEGYKFEHGMFRKGENSILLTSMTVHADGVVVESRSSTEDSDAFLEDVVTWASKEYGLPSLNELPIK